MADMIKPRGRTNSGTKAAASVTVASGKRKRYDKVIGRFRFSEADVLGEGAYGSVYKAYDVAVKAPETAVAEGGDSAADQNLPAELQGCLVVALKQMSNTKPEDGLAAATLREIAILQELTHVLRSEQRQSSITHLGGLANYVNNGSMDRDADGNASGASTGLLLGHSSYGWQHRGGGGTGGDAAELSLTDQGNTGEAAEDCNGGQSTPSSAASPGGHPSLYGSLSERELAVVVAQGRRHVVDLQDVVFDSKSGQVFIALEFCEGGDAWHFLRKLNPRRIRDPRVFRRWVREVVLGVAFMHQKHISHRDLKPQNIMLKRKAVRQSQSQGRSGPPPQRPAPRKREAEVSREEAADSATGNSEEDDYRAGDEFTLKVADFGLSRVEGIPVKKYMHEAVTLWYRSPDVILGNTNYTYSVDVWSLGCIIIEIASGAAPFRGKDEHDQLKCIFSRVGGPLRKDLPSLMAYSHSEAYSMLLERMALSHEKEKEDGIFTGAEAAEMRQLLTRSTGLGPLSPAAQSVLEEVAANKARLRLLLENRKGGMDVLGEDGLDMVARMLIVSPKKRLTILEAVQHPFMRACFNDALEEEEQEQEQEQEGDAAISVSHSMPLTETGGDGAATGPSARSRATAAASEPRRPPQPHTRPVGASTVDGAAAASWATIPGPHVHPAAPAAAASARAGGTTSQPHLPDHAGHNGHGRDGGGVVSLPVLTHNGSTRLVISASDHVPTVAPTGSPKVVRVDSASANHERRGSSAVPMGSAAVHSPNSSAPRRGSSTGVR